MRLALFVLLIPFVIGAAPEAGAQDREHAYPIKGADGSPVLNHRVDPKLAKKVEQLPGHVVVGNPDGDVTLAEFYDLNCPYCRQASADLEKLLREDPNLRLVLVPFPVLGVPSIIAGRVELAVAELVTPQQFYRFHRKVYSGRGVIDGNRALDAAKEFKIPVSKLVTLANDGRTTAALTAHFELGNKLGAVATPSYVAGNALIAGHPGYASLKRVVASLRKCGEISC